MMEKELHQLLLSFDTPLVDCLPPDFNYQVAMAEVEAFAAALAALDYEIELDEKVQDATFFTDLWCKAPLFGIRFSGFGRLVLISAGDVSHKSDGFPADVLEALQQRHYHIIRPEQIEGALYDGTANQFATKITWFERYFDYL